MVKIWLVSSGSNMTSGLLYVCLAVTEHKHNTNGKLTLKHISLQHNVVSPFSRSQLDHPTFLFNADATQKYSCDSFTIKFLQFSFPHFINYFPSSRHGFMLTSLRQKHHIIDVFVI